METPVKLLIKTTALLLFVSLLQINPAQAGVFKCQDSEGRTIFQDQPCNGLSADIKNTSAVDTPHVSKQSKKRAFIWEASTDKGTTYLLGSIHFGSDEMYPLADVILDAYNTSKALVVEANILAVDQLEMATIVASKGVYLDGSTLEQNIAPATWRSLTALAQEMGLPAELMQRQKPWFATLTLTTLALQQSGYSEELGIDKYFLKLAQGNKSIIELESVSQQLDIFDSFTPQEQEMMLSKTIEDINKNDQYYLPLINAWLNGDSSKLNTILNKSFRQKDSGMDRVQKLLLTDRNHTMANKIEKMMGDGGSYFVVVGAGHLVGENGIVEILKTRGYKFQQL